MNEVALLLLRGMSQARVALGVVGTAVVFTGALAGCHGVTTTGCTPSATRVGWRVVAVSTSCDTSVAWIIPPPPGVPSGHEEEVP
ncbi:MAG TPA: hypothetical protein VIV88_16890 [Gemmatimonadales bacterium]|jgi:hypothetical protein